MVTTEHPTTMEQARNELRQSLRKTRWLRRITVLLALVIGGLVLMIRYQG